MRFSLIAAVFLFCRILTGEWTVEPLAAAAASRGAALDRRMLFTWGEGAYRDGRKVRSERFGPGGCLYDVNSDGHADLILHRLPGEMIWAAGPDFRVARRIDTEADFADCMGAVVLGRRGVLVTHRGLQVRFYEIPVRWKNGKKWAYREIYSFYTASYQAGLLLRDINGDGLPDLLCGNYWIESPRQFALPWRLFAINTYNEELESARVRLQWTGDALLVSQPALGKGRVSVFTPPRDPKELWRERLIAADLDHPRAAMFRNGDLLVSEGQRLWLYQGTTRRLLHDGVTLHSLLATDDGFLGVGERGALRLKQLP
ncbi:MAG: hypothetical protein JNL62_00775 [Bryobacterales bacterium]|nr:hypothetical protein [Bryobacterales bacterium]